MSKKKRRSSRKRIAEPWDPYKDRDASGIADSHTMTREEYMSKREGKQRVGYHQPYSSISRKR